jgi:hypothetical protein
LLCRLHLHQRQTCRLRRISLSRGRPRSARRYRCVSAEDPAAVQRRIRRPDRELAGIQRCQPVLDLIGAGDKVVATRTLKQPGRTELARADPRDVRVLQMRDLHRPVPRIRQKVGTTVRRRTQIKRRRTRIRNRVRRRRIVRGATLRELTSDEPDAPTTRSPNGTTLVTCPATIDCDVCFPDDKSYAVATVSVSFVPGLLVNTAAPVSPHPGE